MRVIPVLDLKGGQVVRGVGGRRDEYRPIRSRLVDSSDPLEVARALRREFDVDELYIADLDAIQDGKPAAEAVRQIAEEGFRTLVDAGLRDVDAARSLLEAGATRVIAALETSPGPDHLRVLIKQLGPSSVIFSVDMQQGRLMGDLSPWTSADPFGVAAQAVAGGTESLIVLDLASVGEGQGVPTSSLCRLLRDRFPDVELITGGGVRNVEDLHLLAAIGVDAALVASALHDGRLTRQDVKDVIVL